MSPHYSIAIEELQRIVKQINRNYHHARYNDRLLISRNKREGHNPKRKKK